MREMNDFNALDMAVLNSRAAFLQNRAAPPPVPQPMSSKQAPGRSGPPLTRPKAPPLLRDKVQNNVKGLIGNWWSRLSSQFGG